MEQSRPIDELLDIDPGDVLSVAEYTDLGRVIAVEIVLEHCFITVTADSVQQAVTIELGRLRQGQCVKSTHPVWDRAVGHSFVRVWSLYLHSDKCEGVQLEFFTPDDESTNDHVVQLILRDCQLERRLVAPVRW